MTKDWLVEAKQNKEHVEEVRYSGTVFIHIKVNVFMQCRDGDIRHNHDILSLKCGDISTNLVPF